MRESMFSLRDRFAVLVALVLPFAVAALLAPFRNDFANTDAALVLVAAVVLVAANGHRLAGTLASVSAAVWYDFFLTPPYERLAIVHREDVETTVLLVVVGVAVTELAVQGRRSRLLAKTDEAYLDAIESTTEVVAANASPAEIIGVVTTHLTGLLGLTSCRFELNRFGGLPRLVDSGRIQLTEGYWDLDQYGMPDGEVEILASVAGSAQGRFVVRSEPGMVPAASARRCAGILAGQVAAALARPARHT